MVSLRKALESDNARVQRYARELRTLFDRKEHFVGRFAVAKRGVNRVIDKRDKAIERGEDGARWEAQLKQWYGRVGQVREEIEQINEKVAKRKRFLRKHGYTITSD